MHAEGWYQDPFKVHADRWFSDGRPTPLVRDGGFESSDPPPAVEYTGPLKDIAAHEAANGGDLARADDPTTIPFDRSDGAKAALD